MHTALAGLLITVCAETAMVLATSTLCWLLTGWDVGEAGGVQGASAGLLAQAGVDLAQLLVQPLQLVLALPGRHAWSGSGRLLACMQPLSSLGGISAKQQMFHELAQVQPKELPELPGGIEVRVRWPHRRRGRR